MSDRGAVVLRGGGPTCLGGVESGSVAGGDATAQQADLVQRGPAVHLGQRDLSHHSELGERAAAHEVEEALAFAGETRRPIGHQAFALSEPTEQDMYQTSSEALHKARRFF